MERYSWRALNKHLALMTEAQVLELLEAERVGSRRVSILERLHQRYTLMPKMSTRSTSDALAHVRYLRAEAL